MVCDVSWSACPCVELNRTDRDADWMERMSRVGSRKYDIGCALMPPGEYNMLHCPSILRNVANDAKRH